MKVITVAVLASLIVASLLQTTASHAAEPTLRQVLAEHGNSIEFRQAMQVAGEAYQTMNATLQVRKESQIYCPPEGIDLTADQYMNVFYDYLKIDPAAWDRPYRNWKFVLLLGLVGDFPCK